MCKKEKINELLNIIQNYIELELYNKAIEILEEEINQDPEEVTYYWFLGLAYLLQEQETEAQTTWFLVMSQGNDEEIEQWTQSLLKILETEAQRQETLGKLKLSWLIRGHIREIEPSLINNLLHLIDLSLNLEYYDFEFLAQWRVIDYLNSVSENIDLGLFFQVIEKLVKYPFLNNIDFFRACINFTSPQEQATLVEILKLAAIEVANQQGLFDYACALTNICLEIESNDIELIHQLFSFHAMSHNDLEAIKAAQKFCQIAKTPSLKAFGQCQLMHSLLNSGNCLEAQKLQPQYIKLLNDFVRAELNFIEPVVRGYLPTITYPLLYLQDQPSQYRYFQNNISNIFQSYLSQWMPFNSTRNSSNLHQNKLLKIGYIAHTLRRHSVGWLSRWLFQYHDREKFKIYIYLINQAEDDITQKWFHNEADVIYNFPFFPQKIAETIQKDEIDILVDLDGFSHAVTFQVLALKPAPIQVTWLGSDAIGLPAIDYFIADPYVLPDEAQNYYQETIWRLPQTYLAVDGFEVAVPNLKRGDLNIPDGAVIYLSVQTGKKRHPDMIRLQMQILKEVPNSYLLIKGRADQIVIKQLFHAIAQEQGVDIERLRFLGRSESEEIHRANLSIADVVLDTYPYNGATTTLETLWMGIPLVTKVGRQFVARNSYTFILNAGLTEGIAWTDAEYVNWGIRLGKDEKLRQEISWKLQQSRRKSALWNTRRFTQEMENAYQQMWIKYLNSHS